MFGYAELELIHERLIRYNRSRSVNPPILALSGSKHIMQSGGTADKPR